MHKYVDSEWVEIGEEVLGLAADEKGVLWVWDSSEKIMRYEGESWTDMGHLPNV